MKGCSFDYGTVLYIFFPTPYSLPLKCLPRRGKRILNISQNLTEYSVFQQVSAVFSACHASQSDVLPAKFGAYPKTNSTIIKATLSSPY